MLLLPASSDIPTVALQMGGLAAVLVAKHQAMFRFRPYLHLIIGEAAVRAAEARVRRASQPCVWRVACSKLTPYTYENAVHV